MSIVTALQATSFWHASTACKCVTWTDFVGQPTGCTNKKSIS